MKKICVREDNFYMNNNQLKTELMSTVDLNSLSKEDKEQLRKELRAQEKAEKKAKEAEKVAYVGLKEQFVHSKFSKLQALSEQISSLKKEIFNDAKSLIELKESALSVKLGRHTDKFTCKDGSISINLGSRTTEAWDDTVDNGIEMIKIYLRNLAVDDNSATLVETIMSLLSKDNKGVLRADKVLQLQQMANKIDNEDFTAGIEIIRDAYRPQESCRFIEVRYRDEEGKQQSLPLSISSVD